MPNPKRNHRHNVTTHPNLEAFIVFQHGFVLDEKMHRHCYKKQQGGYGSRVEFKDEYEADNEVG
jgi:hypothetical protein